MTRRSLLASAAALCGAGAVAKALPVVLAPGKIELWLWCDRPVKIWKLTAMRGGKEVGGFVGSGSDREGYDWAFRAIQEHYPLEAGFSHLERLEFATP